MAHPTFPQAANLIQTRLDFRDDATGHGYASVVGLARTVTASHSPAATTT